MAFTPITLTGTYALPDGSIPSGTVTFTPTAIMEQAGEIVSLATLAATLDPTGHFSIVLFANDDPATVPTGTAYTVKEYVGPNTRTYNVIIPRAAAAGTIDLSALSPTTTVPNYSYLLAANNLSDIANPATARANLGLTPVIAPAASGDVTGVTDAAALAALAADGVTIVLRPYQTYYVTSLPNVTPRRGLRGIGLSTVVNHTGNGPCLTITNPNSFTSATVWNDNMAGLVGGFIIDGTSHSAGASCGIQVSDIYAANLKDIVVRNYAGTAGWLGGTPGNQTIGGSVGATLTSLVGGNLLLGGASGVFPNGGPGGVVTVPTTGGTALLAYTGRGTNLLSGISIVSGTGTWTVSAGSAYLNRITGDAGIWFNNVALWTERMYMENVATANCQNGSITDASTSTHYSHEYCTLDVGVHALAGQNGHVIQGGSHLNGTFRSYGNYEQGAGNTGNSYVLVLDPDGQGSTLGGVASPGAAMVFDLRGEADGTGTAHSSIFFGPNAILFGGGIMYVPGIANGNLTLPNSNFAFYGNLKMGSNLGAVVQGQALTAIGSVTATAGFKSGNGSATTGGTLWSGSGAPSIAASVTGDFYFRTDTPGVANQRLYVATAANVWSGIL